MRRAHGATALPMVLLSAALQLNLAASPSLVSTPGNTIGSDVCGYTEPDSAECWLRRGTSPLEMDADKSVSLLQRRGLRVVEPGPPAAYWRFEELEGMRTVTDDSGGGQTLTLRRSGQQHPWAELEVGRGLAGGTGIRFFSRSSATTVVHPFRALSIWLKLDPGCCDRIDLLLHAVRGEADSGSEYFTLHSTGGQLRAKATSQDGKQVEASAPLPIATESDGWLHVAVTLDSDQVTIYKDGAEAGKSAGKAAGILEHMGEEDLTLTLGTGGPHHPFLGVADELRLYASPLQAGVAALLAAAESTGGLMEGESAPIRADAGPAQSLWLIADSSPLAIQLTGSCTGGAVPLGVGTATVKWELASSPTGSAESLTIADPENEATQVICPAPCMPGDYILTFTCSEGEQSRLSQVTLAVFEPHEEAPAAVQLLHNSGQPAVLPGVPGADATPAGLWLLNGDTTNAGKGSQAARLVRTKGAEDVYNWVTKGANPEDVKFGGGALHLRCESYNCVQLDLGNAEPPDRPWPALSVSVWFKSSKHQKLAFITKGSFEMPCPKMEADDANQWHHYVVAIDEKIHKVYFDGLLTLMESPGAKRTHEDAADNMTFGIRSGTHPAYGFDGIVDDLAVFDYVLSNEEVEILRTKGAKNLKKRPADNPYNRGDYPPSMIKEYFPEMPIKPDYTGFFLDNPTKQSSLKPYVHPRIFFTPQELPALRENLRSSMAARVGFQNLLSLVQETFPHDIFSKRNFTLQELLHDKGEYANAVPQLMIMEAFRCLVQADRVAAVRFGQQLDSLADQQIAYIQAGLEEAGSKWLRMGTTFDETDTWQHLAHDAVLRTVTAFSYDFLYPYLAPRTRDKVRRVLSLATNNTWSIGMDGVQAYRAYVSNWIPWVTGDLFLNLLAIEGEDGFDEGVYDRSVKVFQGWTNLGVSASSGSTYEGGGKNALAGTKLVALAKHGHPEYIASPGPRRFGSEYLLHCMLPNGKLFQDDAWGGLLDGPKTGDIAGLKFAFPEDKVIDFVYRHFLRGQPSGSPGEPRRREYQKLAVSRSTVYAYNNDLLNYIYAVDFTGPADIVEHEKQATADVPLTYIAKDLGLVVARSAWADKDAAWFALNVRTLQGGHPAKARGEFLFYALGETWAYYPHSGDNMETDQHSSILVDGKGQSSAPGKFLSFVDAQEATFASCDLRYPYSHAQWQTQTVNDFMVEKGQYRWMDLPYTQLPHWFRGIEKSGVDKAQYGQLEDFQRAFRTAGLVRSGSVPYALILDDIQKDDTSRNYTWRMVLQPSRVSWSTALYEPGPEEQIDRSHITAQGKDLILEGVESGARLLVRLLPGSSQATIYIEGSGGSNPAVIMSTQAKSARIRVLLWPLREGAKLPSTSWDEGSRHLTIKSPDGSAEMLKFDVSEEGLTSVTSLKTGGKWINFAEGSGRSSTLPSYTWLIGVLIALVVCLPLASLARSRLFRVPSATYQPLESQLLLATGEQPM